MTLAILLIEVGALLVYAGITGKSVRALLLGDSTKAGREGSLSGAPASTGSVSAAGGATGSRNLVQIGRQLQAQGFEVSEHPAFGGVTPGAHAARGYHPAGRAIDVNYPGGGTTEGFKLMTLYNSLRELGGWTEILLEDVGKLNQHLHLAI